MSATPSEGQAIRLDAGACDAALGLALGTVLSGVHPFAGDPFQRREDLEVVGEELTVWRADFPARLRRASGQATVLALRSQRGDDDRIEVIGGWELPLPEDEKRWWDVASGADLVWNGLEWLLLDRSAAWAILVVPDAQLVGGDRRFTQAYFGGELGKEEAAGVFISQVTSPEGYEEFLRLAGYLRFSVDGRPFRPPAGAS